MAWVTVPPSPTMLLIFLKNQCVMGCPPGVKGRRLGDPPVVWLKGQPDPLEGPHPLPRMSLPSLAACSPPRLIAEVELERAGGPGWRRHAELGGGDPKCDWHNLDVFTRVDGGGGAGVSYGSGDLRRLFFKEGQSWGNGFWLLPLHLGGPGLGEGPGGVCWRRRLRCILLMTFFVFVFVKKPFPPPPTPSSFDLLPCHPRVPPRGGGER